MAEINKEEVVAVLNRILEYELAGVVRYTHYSLLVFGFGRIPIRSWLREQADESLLHAQQAGEWITTLGAYPSLAIGPLLDSHTFDIYSILRESLQAENLALQVYRELLNLVADRSVALEEYDDAGRTPHAPVLIGQAVVFDASGLTNERTNGCASPRVAV
jgi:bacterioferritin